MLIDSIPLEIPPYNKFAASDEAPEVSICDGKFTAFDEIQRLLSISPGYSK
jgi:hypothetical protein